MQPLSYVATDVKTEDTHRRKKKKKNTAGINIVRQQTTTGTVLY
jgi:hypothetical protein